MRLHFDHGKRDRVNEAGETFGDPGELRICGRKYLNRTGHAQLGAMAAGGIEAGVSEQGFERRQAPPGNQGAGAAERFSEPLEQGNQPFGHHDLVGMLGQLQKRAVDVEKQGPQSRAEIGQGRKIRHSSPLVR